MDKEDNRMIQLVILVLMIIAIVPIGRILAGPTLADRVVAMDVMNTLITSLFVILALKFRTIIYMDIAVVYAMLSFVSTLYIAKYIEEKK